MALLDFQSDIGPNRSNADNKKESKIYSLFYSHLFYNDSLWEKLFAASVCQMIHAEVAVPHFGRYNKVAS